MAMGGGSNSLFALFDIDVAGEESLGALEDKLLAVQKRMDAVKRKSMQMQSAFQAQTMPDLQTGKSIFAGQKGQMDQMIQRLQQISGPDTGITPQKRMGRQAGSQLSPLNNALQEAQQMSLGANEGMRRYKSTVNDAGERIMQYTGSQEMLEKQQKKANNSLGQGAENMHEMMNKGMNLLFAGMALNMVFGSLARSMLKMTGASTAMSASVKSVLLPFFLAITPALIKLSMLFMDMPKPIKMVVGAFVALMAVIAPLMMLMGQLALASMATGMSMLTLALVLGGIVFSFFVLGTAIAVTVAAFKKLGPIVGTLVGILAGGMAVAALYATGTLTLLTSALASATGSSLLTAASMNIAQLSLTSFAATAAGTAVSAITSLVASLYSAITAFLSYAVAVGSSALAATSALAASVWGLFTAYSSLLLPIGALLLGLFVLNRVFKKFGPVVGLLATIIGGVLLAALSPVAAAVFAIFGAFKAVSKIFKKFGKIAGVIVGAIVVALGILIAIFASVPVGIGLAIGALLAIIWHMRSEIGSAINKIVKFVVNLAKGFGKWLGKAGKKIGNFVKGVINWFKSLPRKINNFVSNAVKFIKKLPKKIKNIVSDLLEAGKKLGDNLIQGVINGIKALGGAVSDAFFGVLPEPLAGAAKGVTKFAGDLVGSITDVLSVNDFILGSDGKLIQPDKNDTIVGFNGNGAIQPGQGSGNVEININNPVMKEDVDVERVVDEVEDRVNRDTRGRSGGI